MNTNVLGFQEKKILELKSLFEAYGYSQYKMNKFEEYDLYASNKDFLLSDHVITFTDLGGKLMALKPDVTLSIVKNSQDTLSSYQKLYYNEHVYRVDTGCHSFKEMQQLGLEAIGSVDDICILEVLILAAKSLKAISNDCILDISHLGILLDTLSAVGIPVNQQENAMRLIGEKNLHELRAFCYDCGIQEDHISWLLQVISASGSLTEALARLQGLLPENPSVKRLKSIFDSLSQMGFEDIFRFDFSAVDDIHYYNGVVFKGYISGVPNSVLSGGQYDNLMRKMHRKANAIGFAVYIDRLERLEPIPKQYDVDVVLLYDATDSMTNVMRFADDLRRKGSSVIVQREKPETVAYKQMIKLSCGEMEVLENHA